MLSFLSTTALAAWPDSSAGRIAAVPFSKRYGCRVSNVGGMNERRLRQSRDMEKPYYPQFEDWTDANGRTDVN